MKLHLVDGTYELFRSFYGVGGQPYHATIPPSYNDGAVIGLNGTRMFGLERASGQALWEFDLPNGPTAPGGPSTCVNEH